MLKLKLDRQGCEVLAEFWLSSGSSLPHVFTHGSQFPATKRHLTQIWPWRRILNSLRRWGLKSLSKL